MKPPLLLPAALVLLLGGGAAAAAASSSEEDGAGMVSVSTIRLSEGVDRPPSPPAWEGQTAAEAKRPPSLPYGPALLTALAGRRVTGSAGGYEYSLLLFHNVTQRKTSDAPSAPGVRLGVWGRWEVVEEGERSGGGGCLMHYTDGDDCAASGNMSRAVVIKFDCSDGGGGKKGQQQQFSAASSSSGGVAPEALGQSSGGGGGDSGSEFTLVDVKEPSTCRYTMTLKTPIPCRVLRRDAAEFRKRPLATVIQPVALVEAGAAAGRKGAVGVRVRNVGRALAMAVGRLLRALWRRVTAKARAAFARGRPVTRVSLPPPSGEGGGVCIGRSGGGGDEVVGSLVKEMKGLRQELREVKTLVLQGKAQKEVEGATTAEPVT